MLGAELSMSDHCLHALFGSTGFQQLGRLEVVDGPRDATTPRSFGKCLRVIFQIQLFEKRFLEILYIINLGTYYQFVLNVNEMGFFV
jgi:hypothetical protein